MNENREFNIIPLSEQDDNLFETDIQEVCNISENPISLNSINLI